MSQQVIVKIESFEGHDTHLRCGTADQDFLFAVVAIGGDGRAEIIDSGYRSYEEAAAAWPEATSEAIAGQ